jgi:hypothetical protein
VDFFYVWPAEMLNVPYPFKDSTHITMRILHPDCTESGENDDMIAIVPQGDDLYHIYYKSGEWTDKTSHMTAFTGDELDNYLENFFFLITRDSQPFRSIQLNIPCMPPIMLRTEDFRKKGIRRSLRNILPLLSSCIKVKW